MDKEHLKERILATEHGDIFYYADTAFSGKPTVIFLHGLSSNHTTWLHAARALHTNGYNSIAPDLRGHGLSDKTKRQSLYRFPVFADDVNRIVEQERLSRFVLVGYSFGGQIALEYAVRYPGRVAGLILISTNHANPLAYRGLAPLMPVVAGCIRFLATLLLWQKRTRYHYYQHSEAIGYWSSVLDGFRTMPLSINFWMLANILSIDFKNAIRLIASPTVIIRGGRDFLVTKSEADDMTHAMPNARAVIMKNNSHFVGSVAQEETAQIILHFLKHI